MTSTPALQRLLLTPGWEMHLLRWFSAQLLRFAGSQSIRDRGGKELPAGAEQAELGQGSGGLGVAVVCPEISVFFLHHHGHRRSPGGQRLWGGWCHLGVSDLGRGICCCTKGLWLLHTLPWPRVRCCLGVHLQWMWWRPRALPLGGRGAGATLVPPGDGSGCARSPPIPPLVLLLLHRLKTITINQKPSPGLGKVLGTRNRSLSILNNNALELPAPRWLHLHDAKNQ